jgi:superfamily I DNA/RNA helicase
VTHSLYFKEFEQRFNYFKLKDKYDVVLLDEAQDSNMVTLSVFNQFNAKRVMVGDSHQKIYGFRGAIDAMEKFETEIKKLNWVIMRKEISAKRGKEGNEEFFYHCQKH